MVWLFFFPFFFFFLHATCHTFARSFLLLLGINLHSASSSERCVTIDPTLAVGTNDQSLDCHYLIHYWNTTVPTNLPYKKTKKKNRRSLERPNERPIESLNWIVMTSLPSNVLHSITQISFQHFIFGIQHFIFGIRALIRVSLYFFKTNVAGAGN